MRKLISTACAAALIGSAAIGPATAAPLVVPQPGVEAGGSVIYVENERYWENKKRHRHGNHHHNNDWNGWWIPGLIIGGVIIGNALSQPRYSQPAGSCGYWSQRCAANWSRPNDYRGCMRYYGCL